MPEIEVAMDLVAVVALILSIFLLAYLTVSLLFPEKF
jgi:K+-transporting ATPase KdpF subunit